MDEYTTLQTCDANIRRPQNILDKIVINSCSAICFISAVLLMVIITVAALCRYIFEVDLYGYEEWAKMLAFWLYFMGAGIGAFNASHVSADLVQVYVKPGRIKTVLTCIRSFFTMLVSILFTWYGYRLFIFGYKGPLGIGIGIPVKHRCGAYHLDIIPSYFYRNGNNVVVFPTGVHTYIQKNTREE